MLPANNNPLGRLGIAWQLSDITGWGNFGINLALSATKILPTPIKILHPPKIDLARYPSLQGALAEWDQQKVHYETVEAQGNALMHPDTTVVHSFGNDFNYSGSNYQRGKKNVGFTFFETTVFSPRGFERGQSLDLILAGSRWNAQILAQSGFKKVAYVMQGVDTQRFAPNPAIQKKFPNQFVIFSGGKLEFRKGQDIVLAAFKIFHQKHPDSVLLTAWHNAWPKISADLASSPHGFGVPNILENDRIDIAEWCARSGLPSSAFIHMGDFALNEQLPEVYCQADIALFPNRAEGGTNLVAMEAMACGVPCILSANTGHLDLIRSDNCYALTHQTPYSNFTHQDWAESNVDEIVAKLEQAYLNRDQLQQIGKQGRAFMEQFTWDNQTRQLIECCTNIY